MLSAIRMDRNKLDTARIYVKDDKEADQAADSLARSCLVIALMFKDDIRIQLVWLYNIFIDRLFILIACNSPKTSVRLKVILF